MALHGSRSGLFIRHRYYASSYAVSAVLAGAGLHGVFRRAPRQLAWLPLVIPALLVARYHAALDRSRYAIAYDSARVEFSRAAEIAAQNDVLFYNLGPIFRRSGLYAGAVDAFTRSKEISPRHLASQSRPHAANRLVEVRAEPDRIAQVERELQSQIFERTGLRRGTAEYQSALAELFEARGETATALASRLRAQISKPSASSP